MSHFSIPGIKLNYSSDEIKFCKVMNDSYEIKNPKVNVMS